MSAEEIERWANYPRSPDGRYEHAVEWCEHLITLGRFAHEVKRLRDELARRPASPLLRLNRLERELAEAQRACDEHRRLWGEPYAEQLSRERALADRLADLVKEAHTKDRGPFTLGGNWHDRARDALTAYDRARKGCPACGGNWTDCGVCGGFNQGDVKGGQR